MLSHHGMLLSGPYVLFEANVVACCNLRPSRIRTKLLCYRPCVCLVKEATFCLHLSLYSPLMCKYSIHTRCLQVKHLKKIIFFFGHFLLRTISTSCKQLIFQNTRTTLIGQKENEGKG